MIVDDFWVIFLVYLLVTTAVGTGTSTIFDGEVSYIHGPFSIAMLNYQRVQRLSIPYAPCVEY